MPLARLTSACLVSSLAFCAWARADDVVKVGPVDVTVPWPTIAAPAVVKRDGVAFRVSGDRIGPMVEFEGGWEQLATRWRELPPATHLPYKTLVVLHTNRVRIDSVAGRPFGVRQHLTGVEREDILGALALWKASVEVSLAGARRVEFDVVLDDDDDYRVPGDEGDAVRLFTGVRATQSVQQKGSEKLLPGYDFALDIGGAGVADATVRTFTLDFRAFSDDATPASLATAFYQGWLGGNPAAAGLTPALDFGFGRSLQEAPAPLAFRFRVDHVPTTNPPEPWIAVAQAEASKQPGLSVAESLGVPQIAVPYSWGDCKVSGGDAVKVDLGTRWHARGGATVHRFAEPVGRAEAFVQVSGDEPWDFVFREAGGSELARYTVAPRPIDGLACHVVPPGAARTLVFAVPGGERRPGVTLEVRQPLVNRDRGRQGVNEASVSVGQVARSDREPTAPDAQPPAPVASKEGLASPESAVQSASSALFASVKDSTVEAQLHVLARSQSVSVAYAACEALAFQGTDQALSFLRSVAVNGPFDLNRQVALSAMRRHGVSGDAGQLWRPLGARSWRARRAATQLVGRRPKGDRDREVTLLTMLMDGEPAVRHTAASLLDADDDLPRQRLLYFAFNDPSEAVRMACVERLLIAKDPATKLELHKLVRDDSEFFASWVISRLAQGTDSKELDAIRLAAVDPRPNVQACALMAMAGRKGDWTADDVKPTLKADARRVDEALLRVAADRRDLVPTEVLKRIASGKDAWLAAEAKRILEGS